MMTSLRPASPSFLKDRWVFISWLSIALFCAIQSLITHRYNNYLIFENTVRNLLHQQSFYLPYPLYHADVNHYGPVFSIVFMPFAVLPNAIGLICWDVFNALLLLFAIRSLPVKNWHVIAYIAIPCLFSAALSEQFNPAAAALIIFSFTTLRYKKGLWSALFVMLGAFIKLYGIMGVCFILFTEDRKRYVMYLIGWAFVLFILPMSFSSPGFIIHAYGEWLKSLLEKNTLNIHESTQDLSIMGFVRNISNVPIDNKFFLAIGLALFGLPFWNGGRSARPNFSLLILASALLFPVLFSTGAEDCTYILAIPAVGIWFVLSPPHWINKAVLAMTLLFSCNFPAIFFSSYAGAHPWLYSMISVPFFVTWLWIIVLATRQRYP